MSDNRQSLSDLAALTDAPKADAPAPAADAPAAETAPADAAPAADAPAAEAPRGDDRDRDGRRRREEPINDHGVSTQGPQIAAVLREQQLDKQGRAYATGRRKDAVARVWLKPGTGKIIVNGRDLISFLHLALPAVDGMACA